MVSCLHLGQGSLLWQRRRSSYSIATSRSSRRRCCRGWQVACSSSNMQQVSHVSTRLTQALPCIDITQLQPTTQLLLMTMMPLLLIALLLLMISLLQAAIKAGSEANIIA
jgi:hypothetical protein